MLLPLTMPSLDRISPLDLAIERMGGLDRLVHLRSVAASGLMTLTMPEQSGPWKGPWLTSTLDLHETYDFAALRIHADSKLRNSQFKEWMPLRVEADFGANPPVPGRSFLTRQELLERLTLDPARLLLFAKVTPDARFDSRANALSFPLFGEDVTLHFDRRSGFLATIETVSAREGFWQAWGDVSTRTFLGNWQLTTDGYCLPYWWSVERNGIRVADHAYDTLIPTSDGTLTLDGVRAQAASLRTALAPVDRLWPIEAKTIAPGIEQYALGFQTQVIVGRGGLLVVDPAFNGAHGERLISDLRVRHPELPIRGVVVSDPYWIHFGGLRPFARRGLPVYCAEGNVEQLRALLRAPGRKSGEAPAPRARLVPIRANTTLGRGADAVEIAPLPGPESDRMLALYLPGSRTLFASDTIVLRDGTLFSNEAVAEVMQAVDQNGWRVDRAFAAHNPLVPWSEVLAALPKQDAIARSADSSLRGLRSDERITPGG